MASELITMLKVLGRTVVVVCLVALGFFIHLGIQHFKGDDQPQMGGWPGAAQFAGGQGGGAPGGYDGARGPTSRPSKDAIPVEVAPAQVTTIQERVPGSGVLEAERAVTVTVRVQGAVDGIAVEEGDSVKADTVLCSVDRQLLEIAKRLAEAQRDRDKAEYDRQLELENRDIASASELDAAKFAAQISAASFEQALLDLTFSQPKTPFDGVVVKRHIEKGQYLRSGDPLFDIADFDPLRMPVFLPDADANRLAVGQLVELRYSRESAPIAMGVVERISPVVDRESLTVEATLSFPDVPAEVRPGSFAHVDIITRTHEDVVHVPRAAVLRRDDTPHVFRVDAGVAQRVEVKTGYEDDRVVEITEGLSVGDLVVVQGHKDLRDHSRVEIYNAVPTRGEDIKVAPPK